MIFRVQEVS